MGIGPFTSFAFPGVYTQTLNQAPLATAAGELRVPAFIGVGDEETAVNNYEMIRGSSAMADNQIVQENVSGQFTGANRDFYVTFFPIVNGDGTGTVTNDPTKIIVYLNGNPIPVASIDGLTGHIYLVNIPALGDIVLVSYYYKRTDTLHSNENLSDQVDGVRRTFETHNYPIVEGNNGGVTTTDPTTVDVRIGWNLTAMSRVNISSVDGNSGQFTLAPDATAMAGQYLTATYYDNDMQDTADILPSPFVSSVIKVGYAPGTTDFSQGTDYVLDSTQGSRATFSTIQWGESYKIISGRHTNPTSTYFDDQISATLFDNIVRRRETTGTIDSTNTSFVLESTPASGQGRGIMTNDPTLLRAYFGPSPTDATVAEVIALNGLTRTATVLYNDLPIPLGDGSNHVFISEYYNTLPDDSWTMDCTVAGVGGTGAYTITGENNGAAMNVTTTFTPGVDSSVFDSAGFSADIASGLFPAGLDGVTPLLDARVLPGYAVAETVTLTFVDSQTYIVTSNAAGGTGSAGDTTGYINQTFVNQVTGFQVTIIEGLTSYQAGDWIKFHVSPTFVTGANPTIAIPSIQIWVTDTVNVGVGDTAILNTYNKSGAEPNIGDFYYVSFYQSTQFDSEGLGVAALYTQEQDVFTATGALSITNKLGLGSHLAFLNGAAALALLQIKKTVGSDDAPDSEYIAGIDYFNEPMPGGIRPNLMEPLTTSTAVLAYLKTSNVIQSGIRYSNERYSWFGFPINTSPTVAQTRARAFATERMMGIYPDGAVTTIPDVNGNDVEYLVGGEMLAAAVTGRDVSPAFDVSEPMTKKPIVGFVRLYRRMDSVTSAQTSNSGLTLLEELAAGIDIKFALTTDVSSVLTRTPSIIRTKDFIQRGTRNILASYIGQKLLMQRISEIEQTLNSYLSALQQAEIITAYQTAKAKQDANDPTIVNVTAYYSPVFPLLWIIVTYNLRSSI